MLALRGAGSLGTGREQQAEPHREPGRLAVGPTTRENFGRPHHIGVLCNTETLWKRSSLQAEPSAAACGYPATHAPPAAASPYGSLFAVCPSAYSRENCPKTCGTIASLRKAFFRVFPQFFPGPCQAPHQARAGRADSTLGAWERPAATSGPTNSSMARGPASPKRGVASLRIRV